MEFQRVLKYGKVSILTYSLRKVEPVILSKNQLPFDHAFVLCILAYIRRHPLISIARFTAPNHRKESDHYTTVIALTSYAYLDIDPFTYSFIK